MGFDSSDNCSAHPSGKIKTQTYKQFQLEHLIKEGKKDYSSFQASRDKRAKNCSVSKTLKK
jgi:hypothetical protein